MPEAVFGPRTPGEMIGASALRSIPWIAESGLTRQQMGARVRTKFPDASISQSLTLADRLHDMRHQAGSFQRTGHHPTVSKLRRDPGIPVEANFKYQVLLKFTAMLRFPGGQVIPITDAIQASVLSNAPMSREELRGKMENFLRDRVRDIMLRYRNASDADVEFDRELTGDPYEVFSITRR